MDLFSSLEHEPASEPIAPGAVLLRGFALKGEQALLSALDEAVMRSPFRHMTTPGGYRMSVGMTNCGSLGWVSDRTGYRYDAIDPETGCPWPAMPPPFLHLATGAAAAAGFENFVPDACLINRYAPGAKLSLHQDKDLNQPIVSVSLGIPAIFQFGSNNRSDPTRRISLVHGDVVVWGGPARLHYHGILPLKENNHPKIGAHRINLTFRRAG